MPVNDDPQIPAAIRRALDASLRDLAAGDLHDAKAAHSEALRLLADYELRQRAARLPA